MANGNPSNTNPIGQRPGGMRSPNDPVKPSQGTFATISLESVEEMLRDTEPETGPRLAPTSDIPPPLHGTTAPRTGVPVPPPPTAADPKRFRYASLIRDDGTLDIQGVYRIGRVPELPVSSEKLLTALMALPADLPIKTRHMMLKVTVTSIIAAAHMPLQDLVEDARLRQTRIQQFHEGLSQERERESTPLRREIQELEELLQAKKAALVTLESGHESAHQECIRRVRGMEEVIAVLTESE